MALSALYTNRLANVVLQESLSRGQMLAKTIFHRAGGIVTGDVDPYVALREDPGLHSILESSIYGDNISFAAIVDTSGTVIVHNNRAMAGRTLAERADLKAVIEDTPLNKLRMIFSGDGQTLEVREPLNARKRGLRLDPYRGLHAADAAAAPRSPVRRGIHGGGGPGHRRLRWRESLRSSC